MPAANPQAREDAQAFMRRVATLEIECCAHCKLGRWRLVEQRGADRAAIAAPTIERPGRTHGPEPACAGLVAMRDRMAHRCAHQPRVAFVTGLRCRRRVAP